MRYCFVKNDVLKNSKMTKWQNAADLWNLDFELKIEKLKVSELLQIECFQRRHDTQHNDIQHNDIQHNNIQHNDIQHNDAQHERPTFDTQHTWHSAWQCSAIMLVFVIFIVMLSVITLSVVM